MNSEELTEGNTFHRYFKLQFVSPHTRRQPWATPWEPSLIDLAETANLGGVDRRAGRGVAEGMIEAPVRAFDLCLPSGAEFGLSGRCGRRWSRQFRAGPVRARRSSAAKLTAGIISAAAALGLVLLLTSP